MSLPWNSYPQEDMQFILSKTEHHFRNLDGSSFLLTGGTGFVGSWVLQFLMFASRYLKVNFSIDVISRKPILFSNASYPSIRFAQHDLRASINFEDKDYSHVLFASTPSNPTTGGLDSDLVMQSTVMGTKNLVEMLDRRNNQVKYLNTSSGAVKKIKSFTLPRDPGINDVYAIAKHEVERILTEAKVASKITLCSPRLYSFAGPGIPLNAHFAIGNFIQDAINGRDVIVRGSPETVRSYLHPIDMTIQLLDCWFTEDVFCFPDIGSFNSVKLIDLAQTISKSLGNGNVTVIDKLQSPTTYVPDLLIPSLNHQYISLEETVERWKTWLLRI